MKRNWRAYGVACLVAAGLAWMGSPMLAEPGPSAQVIRVDAIVNAHTVRIEAKASGRFEYTTYRPNENLFVVDLAGVSFSGSEGARVLKSNLVSSYRLLQSRAGERAIVRLEVLMRTPVEPRVERQGEDRLALIFEGPAGRVATPTTEQQAARAASLGSAALAIHRVELSRTEQQTQVRVDGNGPLSYQKQRLSQPERLVLDFAGARLRVPQKSIASDLPPVRGVRLAQFQPDVARVVIDLESEVRYTVRGNGNSVTAAFGSTDATGSPAVAREERPRFELLTASLHPVVPRSTPMSPQMTIPRLSLPVGLTQSGPGLGSLAATTIEPPAPSPRPMASDPAPALAAGDPKASAQASKDPKETATKAEPQAPGSPQMAPALAPAAEPADPKTAPQVKYTGEPISVNLKDVDLKDFFRLIHEISGLNVVVDPTVRGSLTIVLDDVPWDQALEIVLRNNSLDKQVEGNVLRIATRDTIKKEAEMRRDLAKAEAEAVDPVTTTRVLSYAKATAMRDTLKRFLSSRGEILADERSNTLIIRDIPGVLPQLDNLIRQLDRKAQQVEIEARVVAATRTFARDIGTQFGFAAANPARRAFFGGNTGVGTSQIIRPGTPPPPVPPLVSSVGGGSGGVSLPLNTNLAAPTPTSGVSFAYASANFALDFLISAAESKGVGKLLSKPKVITQNNEKAIVKQGTKIPVQTIINNTISVQFVDAVLKLEVTPQITAEGTVYMEVLVENTQIDQGIPRIQGIPALNTQAADTKVLVTDGGTVVMGGVIISSQRTDINQVPLLGSVPLIGHLFKRTTVSTQSQELLFFITPRIVPS